MTVKRRAPGVTVEGHVAALEQLFVGCTRDELLAATGMTKLTVRRLIGVMRAHKLIHVSEYRRDSRGNLTVQVFLFGNAPDVPRPRKVPVVPEPTPGRVIRRLGDDDDEPQPTRRPRKPAPGAHLQSVWK